MIELAFVVLCLVGAVVLALMLGALLLSAANKRK